MPARTTHHRMAGIAAATIALTAAVGGAWATSAPGTKDNVEVLHGCVRLKTGALRIEKPNSPCVTQGRWRIRERPIAWNQAGVPGEQGPPGQDGTDGERGAQGPAGPRGLNGAVGPIGPEGADGADGKDGDDGAPGLPGLPGLDGVDGVDGVDGKDGLNGTNGRDGRTILSGASAPTGSVGADGDFYLDTVTATLYGPKAAGVWPTGISLEGPQGKTGQQGPQGLTGPPGPGADVFGTNTGKAVAGNGVDCTMGSILLTAANVGAGIPADGRSLRIQDQTALFSLIGTQFGGDGVTTFRLPDLTDAAPNGLTYTICDDGFYPARR